jgi:general secretion pathway protein A
MYTDYFGIEENPFSITPDPRYMYMGQGHQEALAHLLYGVLESGGFVLLTGEIGTGKTSTCRYLVDQLPDNVDVALILNPMLNEIELVATICDDLGIAYPEGTKSLKILVDVLNRHLLDAHARGHTSVVIIDEAQDLGPAVLEQLRLLTNLETDKRKLLQIVLVGQPELNDLLNREEMRQLVQRITARYHLRPLSEPETEAYIHHRLAVAGLEPDVFDPRTITFIHKLSGGIPRLINSLCDRCLLGAYAQEVRLIDKKLAKASAREVLGSAARARRRAARMMPLGAAAVAVVAGAAFVILDPLDLGLGSRLPHPETIAGISLPTEPAPGKVRGSEPDRFEPDILVPESAEAPAGAAETSGRTDRAERLLSELVPSTDAEAEDVASDGSAVLGSEEIAAAPSESNATAAAGEAASAKPSAAADMDDAGPAAGATSGTEELTASPSDREGAPADDPVTSAMANLSAESQAGPEAITPENLFTHTGIVGDLETALVTLFGRWQRNYVDLKGFAPCTRAGNAGLQCLQGQGTRATLAILNRPALIRLTGADDERLHAVVTALQGSSVTLDFGGREVVLQTAQLAPLWSGDYLILWEPPSAYHRVLQRGMRGRDVAWIKNRLAELRGEPAGSTGRSDFDSELEAQVKAFQRSRSLKVDGIAGAWTVIHLNAAGKTPGIPLLHRDEP